jgi:hypothetical protein
MRTLALCSLALLALAGTASSAQAQTTVSLFGKQYSVQRFDYYQQVQWPSPFVSGTTTRLTEVEGTYFVGGDKMYFSSDALGEVFLGEPKNQVIEARLTFSGPNITGLEYVRTLVTSDPTPPDFFNLDVAGVTINPTSTGRGAGGNLVLSTSEGFLEFFGVQPSNLGQQLGAPVSLAGAGLAVDCEDLVFVPAFGVREAAFYTMNQEFPSQAVRVEIDGTIKAQSALPPGIKAVFPIAADVPNGPGPLMPKGMTYIPDAPNFPASIRIPGGVLIVACDNDLPGLQAFDFDGNLVGYAPLTADGTSEGPSLLPLGDCFNQIQIESMSVDPATGRLFLTNQGSGDTCNIIWILTPLPSGCNPADIADNGSNAGSDGCVDNGDFSLFISQFFNSSIQAGCTGATNPCAASDIADNGSNPGADGFLDNGDFSLFISSFFGANCTATCNP